MNRFAYRSMLPSFLLAVTAMLGGCANAATLQAQLDAADQGDTITVPDGIYAERLYVRKALTLISETRHGAQIIGGIEILHGDVVVDGFHVRDVTRERVGIGANRRRPPINNVTVRNCLLERVQMGIVAWGDDWLIDSNEIRDLRHYVKGDVDYMRGFGSRLVVSNNYVHGTDQEKIGEAHVDGFQSFTNNGEHLTDALFSGNTFADIHQGIILSDSRDSGKMGPVIIRDNIFKDKLGKYAWGVLCKNAKGVEVRNNLFIEMHHAVGVQKGGEVVSDKNIFQQCKNPHADDGGLLKALDNYTTIRLLVDPDAPKLPKDSPALGFGPSFIQPN